ncbi:hypothetical protein ACOMHN_029583 [Nucella lapillus]
MASVNSTPWFVSSTDSFVEFNNTMTTSIGNTSTGLQNVTEGVTSSSAAGASIVSPIVMFLTGFIGNVLALLVLHKTRTEIRSMMFYTLVAALTWNDLVGICLTSPPVLAAYLNQRHMPALPSLCRFHALAMVCFGLSTPFIVCAMAIERSLALKCSYFYSKYCTPASARLVVVLLWAFVLFFGALPLLGVGSFTLQYPKTWCFLHFRSYVPVDMAYASAYAILNLSVIVVMIFCNGLVMTTLCRVRKSRRSRRSMSNTSSSGTLLKTDSAAEEKLVKAQPPQMRRRQHRDVELQMIWLLCFITTIFSVCWAPLMVYILFCLQSPANSSPVFGLVAVRLASLNQTINPWIYVILRKSLLSRLRRLCQECFLCRHLRLSCRRGSDYKTSQVSEATRKPTQYHNPPIYLHRKGGRNSSNSSVRNKYVHVGNQLCPSSQFVGYQELRFASEGRGGASGKRRGGGGSKSRESQSGSRWISETNQGWIEVSSGGGMCSVCRDRVRCEGNNGGENRVDAGSLSICSSLHGCSHAMSPMSGAACDQSTEENRHPLSLPVDGAYVDFFRHLPPSGISLSTDVTGNDVSTPPYRSQACRGEASETNVLSCISEADDHGYSSKVSTDSSRMSTPERSRPGTSQIPDSATNWEQETDFTQLANETENWTEVSDRNGTQTGASEQIHLKDLNEHSIQKGHINEMDVTSKETPLHENCSRQNDSTVPVGGQGASIMAEDCGIKQHRYTQDVDPHTRTDASKEHYTRNVKPNVQNHKLNHNRRDDSLDFTSGVFDCRDDDDDDDDVYDDNVDPGPDSTKEEGKEGERHPSSSRTMSTSSGGTLVDSSSGHDTASVLYRHLSTSSAH